METKSLFLQQIGQFVSTQSRLFTSLKSCYDKPTKIFEDNKGTIDMCAAERVISNHKHINVSLQYLPELHKKVHLYATLYPHMYNGLMSSPNKVQDQNTSNYAAGTLVKKLF